MDSKFYKDLNKSISYVELITRLNNTRKVVTNLYRYDSLDFFVNLLGGLLSNLDMVLLDNDFSNDELEKVCGSLYKEEKVEIKPLNLFNVQDLIQKIRKSNSRILLYTSGTTGFPKLIEHSVESITLNIKTDDRFKGNIWAFAYNPSHMAGIQVFFQAFLNENCLVNIFGLSKLNIFRLIDEMKISHISATPSFYRLLLPTESIFKTVKQITFGGEKSDKNLHQKMLAIFPMAKVINVYASTEAGALLGSKDDGFIIPLRLKDRIKIEDGELFIHKSLIGKDGQLHDGENWYATGDIVEFLDVFEGVFRILGRKSEIINIGGYKVNPNEVEEVIRSIVGINETKVYGIPNSVLGNIIVADIVREDVSITESEIKNYLSTKLQSFKIPRRLYFKDKISMSRTGKLDRKNG